MITRPFVADIGSGNDPFPLANILVERYLDDNLHRGGHECIQDGRVMIVADVEHLPFGDQVLDFAFCRDVIEHVLDPKQACRELMRVAKAGIILCPSMFRDWTASRDDWENWETHRWWVVRDGSELKFSERRKDLPIDEVLCGQGEYVLGNWGGNVR